MIIKNRYNLEIVCEFEKISDKNAIVFHGHSGNRKQPHIQFLINLLKENNYSVISFDATNSLGESQGDLSESCFTKHYQDLEDVISYFDLNNLLLVGQSLGAMASLYYAAKHPEKVLAVASFSSPIAGILQEEYLEILKPGIIKFWKHTGFLEYESSSRKGLIKKVPWKFMEDSYNYDLRKVANDIKCPIFLCSGNVDRTVNWKNQIEFGSLVDNSQVEIIDQAPHTFSDEKHLIQIKDLFNNWMTKNSL